MRYYFISIAFAILAIFIPNTEAMAAKSENANMPDSVQHEVLAFELEGLTDKGDKKWAVTGQSAVTVSPTEVKMSNITAKAFGDEAQATITADKGIYDKAKNNVRLEQNVNAEIETTQKGGEDYLSFPANSGATGANKNKEGASPDKNAKKKTTTVITCDGEVEFDYEKNRAYFNRNVKVTSDSGRIEADRITVYLDTTTKRIKEIAAEGNVKIIKGENITYSDKATYVEAEKKVILTGSPKLVIYQEGDGLETNFMGK